LPRIRSIRPDAPQYPYLRGCTRDARLFYFLLKTQVDDFGRVMADATLLASLMYPYERDVDGLIPLWQAELVRSGAITVYEVEGVRYLVKNHFLSEERVDKPTASRLPQPGGLYIQPAQLMGESVLHNPRIVAAPREPSRALANPRESSRDQPADSASESTTSENQEAPRESSRAFASPREPSRLLSGKEGKGLEGRGGGVGEGTPTEELFGFTGLDSEAPTAAGKRRAKLPNPYPFTPEHEKVGRSILPNDADVEAEFRDGFCAYWHSRGEPMADWLAAWRTWCSRGVTNRTYRRKPPEPTDGGQPKAPAAGLDWHVSGKNPGGGTPRKGGA